MKKSRVLRLGRDVLVALAIYGGLNYWQTKDLLPKDSGVVAPSFRLKTLSGDVAKLGEGPSVVYFFAPWCQVCDFTSENVNGLKESVGEGLEVLAVALSYGSSQEVSAFAKKHNLKIPVLLGNDEVGKAFKIQGFPTFYFIDKNGYVRNHTVGYTSEWGLKLR